MENVHQRETRGRFSCFLMLFCGKIVRKRGVRIACHDERGRRVTQEFIT
jgi:hypothetical protein